jgi:hypothetical protein
VTRSRRSPNRSEFLLIAKPRLKLNVLEEEQQELMEKNEKQLLRAWSFDILLNVNWFS